MSPFDRWQPSLQPTITERIWWIWCIVKGFRKWLQIAKKYSEKMYFINSELLGLPIQKVVYDRWDIAVHKQHDFQQSTSAYLFVQTKPGKPQWTDGLDVCISCNQSDLLNWTGTDDTQKNITPALRCLREAHIHILSLSYSHTKTHTVTRQGMQN